MHAKSLQLCPTLCDPMDHSPRGSLCPWDSPGKNTEVGCHDLLQGIKPRSPALQVDSLPLSHWGSPKSPQNKNIHYLQAYTIFTF